MTEPLYKVKAEFFKTLGHPARIRILELLVAGDKSVAELLPEVGLESSNLSQQLGVLRRAGVVDALAEKRILGGVPASRLMPHEHGAQNLLIVAATETSSEEDCDAFAKALAEVVS